MKKILVLIEDFSRNNLLSSTLKKIGFDVLSSQQEVGYVEKMLSFAPEIVLLDACGKKINGIKLIGEFHKRSYTAKSILVFANENSAKENLTKAKQADAILVESFSFVQLLKQIEKVGGPKAIQFQEKLKNLNLLDAKEEALLIKEQAKKTLAQTQVIKEKSKDSVSSFAEKNDLQGVNKNKHDKYLKFTENIQSKFNQFPKDQIQEEIKFYRENADTPEVKAIDEERKAFVVELFKNAKK